MFDIDKSHCVTIEQKLLWNINEHLKECFFNAPKVEIKQIDQPKKTCTYCGGIHETHSQLMLCAKKNKRKGVAK